MLRLGVVLAVAVSRVAGHGALVRYSSLLSHDHPLMYGPAMQAICVSTCKTWRHLAVMRVRPRTIETVGGVGALYPTPQQSTSNRTFFLFHCAPARMFQPALPHVLEDPPSYLIALTSTPHNTRNTKPGNLQPLLYTLMHRYLRRQGTPLTRTCPSFLAGSPQPRVSDAYPFLLQAFCLSAPTAPTVTALICVHPFVW